jgi:hypothetical protein
MKRNPASQSGLFNPRVLLAPLSGAVCSVSAGLAILSFAANSPRAISGNVAAAAAASTPLASTGPGWSIVTSSNTSATQTNYLNGVTCASANDCWAVGYYNNGSGGSGFGQTLSEHWNGSSWMIVPSPNSSTTQTNYLNAVTCTSGMNCWAVGYYFTASGVAQTLAEHWDGTSWSIVPSNNSSPAQNNYFYDVTCTSAANCWAVGYFFNGTATQALIERWDGTAWASAISPTNANRLFGVTCVSSAECWAVGDYFPSGHAQTLIEHWDGTSWAIVPSPNSNPEQDNTLYSVTCSSAADCWAVGSYDPGGDSSLSLIEYWNGRTLCPTCPMWVIVSSPNNGPTYLNDVTCTSNTNCWAVGYYFDNETTFRYYSLTEQWNGSSWAIVTSSNRPSPNNNYLYGVTCASASECWAVGYSGYFQNGINYAQTLIEKYSPTIPPLTSVGSRKIHGGTPFDVDLLTTPPGIECRSPGATGTPAVDYKIVFTFVNDLTSCGTASNGSLSNGPSSNQCTVDLIGVANQQYVTVTLNNVLDSQNNTGNLSATMGLLLGDVTGNKSVSNTDVASVKGQVSAPVTSSNFRNDVNANGVISNTDVSLTKGQVGTALP